MRKVNLRKDGKYNVGRNEGQMMLKEYCYVKGQFRQEKETGLEIGMYREVKSY